MFFKIMCYTEKRPLGFVVGIAHSQNQANSLMENISKSGEYPDAISYEAVQKSYYPYYI